MKGIWLIAALGASVLSGTAAGVANADPLVVDPSKVPADRNQWAPQVTHKSFEWDAAKSRWGLRLDIQQQPGQTTDWKNVQAGAYFKLTPSLHIGAGVTLVDPSSAPTAAPNAQVPPPPRVQLETGFKF